MRNDTKFLKIILALSLVGILVSGWLLSLHIKFSTGSALLTESCTIPGASSSGCASIAVSKYSFVFGAIPLAAIAMSFYFTLVFLVFWAIRNPQASYEAIYVGFFLSTVSILVTALMAFISRAVLQAFCPACAALWIVNLLIWPAFVKQMGLRWGNALAANLELIRSKDMNLLRKRVVRSFAVAAGSFVVFSVIGTVAESMQEQENMFGGGREKAVADFREAKQVFLPPEAYGGAQSKGLTDSSKTPVLDIVEFADFQCPACRMAARYLKPFVLKHKDEVRLSYRMFPLDGSCNPYAPNGAHVMGCAAARSAYCAGKQGKFFEYHDLVFDNQDDLSTKLLDDIAGQIGLDKKAFDACRTDSATESALQKEMSWGELIGLESTPTLVINGRRLSGALAPAQLEELFKAVKRGDSMETHDAH